MNSCKNDAVKLDYINGLLSGRSKKRFQRHLSGCAACSKEVNELAALVAQLHKLRVPEVEGITAIPSSSFAAEAPQRAVPFTRSASRGGKLRWLYFLSAAVVLSATALLFFVFRLEGVRTWVSSWLSPSLLKIQGYLGMTANGDVNVFQFLLLILSLSSLMLIPSIVENVYLLMRRKWNL